MCPGVDVSKEIKQNECPAFRKMKDHQKSVGNWRRLVWKVYTCAIKFTNKSRGVKPRLPLSLAIRKSSPARQFEKSPKVSTFRLSLSLGSRYLVIS